MSTISAIILHPLHPHGPGRAGSPIWALRLSHTPRGWASWGSSFVAFYEESRTPPRSPPHLPRAPSLALRPQGPGTTVAGPTQDQGAWASPLSLIWGGETGAFPHHTCGCSHIPLTIPGKNKTAELHRSQLSPEETTSVGAWVRWGGVEKRRRRSQELEHSFWGDRRSYLSPFWEGLVGRRDSGSHSTDLCLPGGILLGREGE